MIAFAPERLLPRSRFASTSHPDPTMRPRTVIRSIAGEAPSLAFLALLVAPLAVLGQTPPEAADRVDEIFAAWDSEMSPGCAVGVSRHGETVLEKAYGMADLEFGVPNTPGSIFEGGSVSKQFTSAAVMLLVLDGVVSLDDDVRKWIPELPDYGKPITVHRLMTHTSGLRDWGSVAGISGWGREDRSHDHDDVLDILSRQSALNFEPGHEYSYSNSGYNLLAMIVTRASGTPFAEFSKQRIFQPLGMNDTQWRDDYRRIVPGRSSAYDRTEDGWEINRPVEYVHGNGGILTTVADLAVWNQALTDGRGLGGDAFLELMHREGTLNDGSPMGYAGGLFVGEFAGVRSVSHTGSTAGYRAFLGRYPEQGLSVAMLCNASNVSTRDRGEAVALAFLGRAAHPAMDPAYAAVSESFDLTPYEGLYREPVTGDPMTLEIRDGVLHAGRAPLLPLSEGVFQVGDDEDHRYLFDGTRGRTTGFREEGMEVIQRRWDRVEPWTPSPGALAEFTGTYRSDDAETTFVVRVEDGGLVVWQRPDDTHTLSAVYPDAFRMRGQMVRFRRNASGGVTALSLSSARVYDMRFTRVED